MEISRLDDQLEFILEADALKQVLRQNLLPHGQRRENVAEHSWHLALMALVLSEHANTNELDLLKVLKMLIVHDIVEIDAGDTFAYDEGAQADKAAREQAAAQRLFGLLPSDQGATLRELWDEFEAGQSPESRFAAALDRLQPLLLNFHTQGATWRQHGVTRAQVLARNQSLEQEAPRLWHYAQQVIDQCVDKGYLLP